MRISDWSSDVCSSDLLAVGCLLADAAGAGGIDIEGALRLVAVDARAGVQHLDHHVAALPERLGALRDEGLGAVQRLDRRRLADRRGVGGRLRSEEHTSELQSLMRISYAVFCLKKKTKYTI